MSGQHQDDVSLAPTRNAVTPPSMYKVVLLNDDYTSMDFVVSILQDVFHHDLNSATQIMMTVHQHGRGIAGIYTRDIAETKSHQVHERAYSEGFPLKCVIEEN